MQWSNITTEEEKRHKTRLKSAEDEQAKKIAVTIATMERKVALEFSKALGYTLENTPGIRDIIPKALGMKGMEVDWDALEIGESLNDVKPRGAPKANGANDKKRKRVDLSTAAQYERTHVLGTEEYEGADLGEFIKLDAGDDRDHEALNYNHKLRRKLRRAIETANTLKEMLVREHAIKACEEVGIEPPPELKTPAKPIHLRGERALEDGTLETAKSERVRLRLELAEFNKAARVLRKQAKDIAMTAGLRVYAEITGRIPPRGSEGNEDFGHRYGAGWVVPEEQPPEFIRVEEVVVI